MSKLLVRQLAMLRLTPRQPRNISTRQMMEALQTEGFNVSHRTVQRDMKALLEIFPGLATDGNRDEAQWFWRREAEVTNVPGIDPQMALSFKLVETFLSDKVPPAILNTLRPYFQCADKVLDSLKEPGLARWSEKVTIRPRTQPLIPAQIKQDVLDVVYQALFKEKQFLGRYQRRDGDEAQYEFHPLGLVFRYSVVYLVATVWDYQDPRHYALHRFKKCATIDKQRLQPSGFSLDEYLKSGAFEYVEESSSTIVLEAIFSPGAAHHLFETPLSADQILKEQPDGKILVTATVKDSQQIRWWLLGFGDQVRLLKPRSLVDEFISIVSSIYQHYETE